MAQLLDKALDLSPSELESWLSGLLRATAPLQLSPQDVAIARWLAPIVEAHRAMADKYGVSLTLDTERAPPTARFDPMHLEHAVTAIVTNAIQASPRGGRVRVCAANGQAGGLLRIRVSDQGPGVRPELAEKIFRPYFTTKKDGTGIGLAMAQSVVEQHGGRITVETGDLGGSDTSGAGPGSVFVITLRVSGQPGVAGGGQISGQ